MYIIELEVCNIRSFAKPEVSTVIHQIKCIPGGTSLLYGGNGAGKTTLIESGKFALTGNHPFSPDKLASFITQHKPGAIGGHAEDAYIRLKALNNVNEEVRISWIFNWNSAQPSRPLCRITVNGTLKLKTSDKKTVENFLNVSSVLDVRPVVWQHVIMSAQEECCWPFNSTPEKVKEIFDGLFGLKEKKEQVDKLEKQMKVLKEKIEVQEIEVEHALTNKNEFEQKQREVQAAAEDRAPLNQELGVLKTTEVILETERTNIAKIITLFERIDTDERALTILEPLPEYMNLDESRLNQLMSETTEQIELVKLAELPKLKQDKTEFENQINKLNLESGKILNQIEELKRITSNRSEIVKALNLVDDMELCEVEAEISSQINEKEKQITTFQDRRIANRVKVEFEKSQQESQNSQNSLLEGQTQVPVSALESLRGVMRDQTAKAEDFQKQVSKEEASVLELLNDVINKIHIVESIQAKIEAYKDVIGILNESACPQCSLNDPGPIAKIQNKIEIFNSKLSESEAIEALLSRKTELLVLLQEEAIVKNFAEFKKEISVILEAEGSGAAVDPGVAPASSGQATRKRRHSSIENSQNASTSTLSISSANSSSQAVEEETQLLNDEEERVIKPLITEVESLNKSKWDIQSIRLQLQRFENVNLEAKQQDCQRNIQLLKESVKTLAGNISDSEKKKSDLEVKSTQLNNQLKVLDFTQKIIKLKSKLEALRIEHFTGIEPFTYDELKIKKTLIDSELKATKSENAAINQKLDKNQGKIDELQKYLNQRLATPQIYQDQKTQLDATKQELKTVTKEVKDLRAYIIQTHKSKLDRINESMKNNWATLYPNTNSRSYMKLRAQLKNPDAKHRIDYIYHIDMCFNTPNKSMKMRGCSSLGEKCFASVVVRCALAEHFAPNCPIFAFDAPEANLDPEVTEHLLRFFQKLAENGKQLLISSQHDEFLDKLKSKLNELNPPIPNNSYYLENQNGFSSITIVP